MLMPANHHFNSIYWLLPVLISSSVVGFFITNGNIVGLDKNVVIYSPIDIVCGSLLPKDS